MMKKILICLTLIIFCFSSMTKAVSAEEYDKEYEYDVVFKADGTIESTFDPADHDEFNNIQPGDNLKITFNLKNEYNQAIDWYMYNTSEAFEENVGKNASYSYQLTYTGMSDAIYDSNVVGGDNADGFEEATAELEDYFLLHEGFAPGETQSVTLIAAVDGETSWNNYQTSFSNIKFQFAVEVPPEQTERHVDRIVYIPYTGDTINLTFYIIAEILALLLLVAVLVAYYTYRRKQREA